MDRPCYRKTFVGFADEIELLEKAIEWLRNKENIIVTEMLYRPSEQNCLDIIYECFPDTDPVMMEYWEQEMGKRHPNREIK